MAFNTGNSVPSKDARDLSDNAENFDFAVNSQLDTWNDRLGVPRDTVAGRIKKMGFAVPINYTSGIVFAIDDNVKTVVESSIVYAPLTDALPFTTSGTFIGDDDARFFVIQSAILEITVPEIFGAVGDGIVDDTVAITNFFTAIQGKTGVLTKGKNYLVSTAAASLLITVDNTTLTGGGKITASDSINHLINISGDGCDISGIALEGDGTTEQSIAIANTSRIALIFCTGDNCTVRRNNLTLGHQNFIHFHNCSGGAIYRNHLFDGVVALIATGYQGIRLSDTTKTIVGFNYFHTVDGRHVVQGIVLAVFSVNMLGNMVINNEIDNAWDHGIYGIGSDEGIFSENIVTSDSSGLVVTGRDNTIADDVLGNTANDNHLTVRNAVSVGTPGLYLRDCNKTIAAHNIINGFPRGIQVSPVQYDSVSNTMNDITLYANQIHGYTSEGIIIAKAGKSLGAVHRLKVINNTLNGSIGNLIANAAGISALIGQEASVNIFKDSDILVNTINYSGNVGIHCSNADDLRIKGNPIINPANTVGAALRAGIFLDNVKDGDVKNNSIKDTESKMQYGIDGNNNTLGMEYIDNRVKGAQAVPLRRTQQGGHTNTHRGNRTGDDPLVGTVTLAAAGTTTINNDNINDGQGYTSRVLLQATDVTAGALVGSVKSPVIAAGDYVAGVSFKVRTANGANAVGTEQFFYEIIQ